MKKLAIWVIAVVAVGGAFAENASAELQQEASDWNSWRLTTGGFGRGNIRAKIDGLGTRHVTAYGVDLDLQYNLWQNDNFNLWMGIGGTFCPRQDASSGYRSSKSRSEHQVSADGYTTYDFNYRESSGANVDLGYGECRLLMVPEWKITDSFSIGTRLGVAFDWVNAKYSYHNKWAWNSVIDINVPGLVHDTDLDSDSGGSSGTDSQTEFAAQAILGLQATYMFTNMVGLYGNFDWRLGGESDFENRQGGKLSVDMSGWYWGVGVVVSF